MRALHDYECDKCQTIFESYEAYEHRHIPCTCGGTAHRIVTSPRLSIFQPGVFENMGDDCPYIETKQQLADECRKRGLQSRYLAEGYDSRREARWI